jgi:hypothetical protein
MMVMGWLTFAEIVVMDFELHGGVGGRACGSEEEGLECLARCV